MYQHYVAELQGYADGTHAYLIHEEHDADRQTAENKGESKYFAVLSAAAISGLPTHAAILFDSEGNAKMSKCYKHGDQGGGGGNDQGE